MQEAFNRILTTEFMVHPGDRILIAVSGGGDSVALLRLFHGFSRNFPCTILAAHLDHGIRLESSLDAEFVRRVCADLGVKVFIRREDIPRLAESKGKNLEEVAREMRRAFLLEIARVHNCRRIALGHHRDDQAETFLQRLMRGAGISGLASMRKESGSFIRPLLSFPRSQIAAWLSENRISFLEDSSNRDMRFTRNRIRGELLPLMETFNPRIVEHLAELSARLAREEGFWEEESGRKLREAAEWVEGGLRIGIERLFRLHPALRLRVLRRALREVRGSLRGITARHLESVENILAGDKPQADVHLPGAWVGRRYGQVYLRRSPPLPVEPFEIEIAGPGEYTLPGGRRLFVQRCEHPRGEGSNTAEFSAAAVCFPLAIRSFRPGDRFRPSGMTGTRKLKDFFIDQKIDREGRKRLALLVGDEILWVAGVRRCEGMRSEEGAVLRFVLHDDASDNPLVNSRGLC